MSEEDFSNLSHLRVGFACDLCECLSRGNIVYSIMHGCENFPDEIGRDIDVLIDRKQLPEAASILTSRATELGWHTILAPIPWAGAPLVFWRAIEGVPVSFEVHLMPQLEWGGVSLVSGSSASESYVRDNEPFPRSLTAAFAKRVIIQVLAGCWEKLHLKQDEIAIYPEETEAVPRYVREMFGTEMGNAVLDAVAKADVKALQRHARGMRKTLLANALAPRSTVKPSPRWIIGKLCKLTGHIPWRLPNVVIGGDGVLSPVAIASEIRDLLCFTKAETIVAPKKWNVISKTRLSYRLRSMTAIFRFAIFVAKPSPQNPGNSPSLRSLWNRRAPLFVVRFKNDPEVAGNCVVEILTGTSREKETSSDSVKTGHVTAYIAHKYLLFATSIATSA